MNTKNNQRFQDMDERIVAEFMALLEERGLDKISVSEICRRCEINRASFYLHYADIPTLMDAIDQRLAMLYGEMFGNAKGATLADSFIELFRFISQHQAFYRSYLEHAHMFRIMEATLPAEASEAMMGAIQARGFEGEIAGLYHMLFFRDGLLAIIKHWLERECAESPEFLVNVLKTEYSPIPSIFE